MIAKYLDKLNTKRKKEKYCFKLHSRNELQSDVLVRLVDELGVEPHVAVVVLQAVALQHLDGEHVALQLREPPPDTHSRSLRYFLMKKIFSVQ